MCASAAPALRRCPCGPEKFWAFHTPKTHESLTNLCLTSSLKGLQKALIVKLCIKATLEFWTFEPPLRRPGLRGKKQTPAGYARRESRAPYRVRRQARGEQGIAAAMAAGCNDGWHGAPLPGFEKVAEHVHVEALAGHQLAQDSNLLQAAAGALKATWRRWSGK